MFGTLLTPESTVTRTALAASTCDEADVLVTLGAAGEALLELLLELPLALLELAVVLAPLEPPPPPPPQALTSSASKAAANTVMNEDR
jgi:hypothetical protein